MRLTLFVNVITGCFVTVVITVALKLFLISVAHDYTNSFAVFHGELSSMDFKPFKVLKIGAI